MPAAPAGSSSIVNVDDARTSARSRTRDRGAQPRGRRRRRHAASRRHQRLGRRRRLSQEHADRDQRGRGAGPVPALRPAAGFGRRRAPARRARDRAWSSRSSRPNTRVTIRNRDRSRFRPWGMLGGGPGEPSNFVVNPGTRGRAVLGNRDIFTAEPGDVVHIHSPGGGGRGDPLERDPSACCSTSSAATCRPRGRRWITASCCAAGR